MTVLAFLLIGLSFALPLAFLTRSRQSLALWLFALSAVHCAAVLVQNQMLQDVSVDAHLYYYDTEMYLARPFGMGTSAVVYFTQIVKKTFNFEFVELMLVFGMCGSIAIIMLACWIHENLVGYVRFLCLILCFMPGLHFWTSSIGKDAPMALGIVLLILAAQDMKAKWRSFGLGVLICLIIRPHILLLVLTAFAAAHILRNRSLMLRIGAVVIAAALFPVAQIVFQNFLGINILNGDDLSKLFTEQQNYLANTLDEGVVFIANPIVRVVYFTFNPLFYNASSATSLMASIENLILIFMMLGISRGFRAVEGAHKPYAIFLALFIVILLLFQGLGGYNVGLALRQKVMVYSALILLLAICEKQRTLRHRRKA
jgi:hypothetical protein